MCYRFSSSFLRLAVGLLLSFSLLSCANPLHDQLRQATASLTVLEQSDAIFYVKEELQSIRSIIVNAERLISPDQSSKANTPIKTALNQLQSVQEVYYKRKQDARNSSRSLIQKYKMAIASYETELKAIPKATYVDQNRHDMIRNKLKKMNNQLGEMNSAFEIQAYPKVAEMKSKIDRNAQAISSIFDSFRSSENSMDAQVVHATSSQVDSYSADSSEMNLEPGMR